MPRISLLLSAMQWFYNFGNNVSRFCGVLVDGLRIELVQAGGIFHQAVWWTHFVRRLWVNIRLFALAFLSLRPQLFSDFISVRQKFYPASTGLTIKTSFLYITY